MNSYLNEYIELNGPDISDIILFSCGTYNNLSTGKKSSNFRDIITDKRFILSDKKEKENLYGYYFLHDKEKDVLFAITTCFLFEEHKWVETSRAVFYKENNMFKSYGEMDGSVYSNDICGQALFENRRNGKEVFKYNGCAGSKKEMLSFFGGQIYLEENGKFLYAEQLSVPYYDLQFTIGEIKEGAIFRPYTMETCGLCLPQIPKEIENKMKTFVLQAKKSCNNTKICSLFSDNIDNINTAYLQRRGDDFYYRVLTPHIFYRYPIENSEITFVDDLPGKVSGELINGKNRSVWKDMILRQAPLFGMDDPTGTVIEHNAYILRDSINAVEGCLEKKEEDFIENSDSEADWFFKKYGIMPQEAIRLVSILSTGGPFEMMYNLPFDGMDAVRKRMAEKTIPTSSENEIVESFFGYEIDKNAKTLWGKYGIQKEEFKYMAEKGCIFTIAYIKNIFFQTKESADYWQRVNIEDKKTLINSLMDMGIFDIRLNIFKKLVIMYGYKNWKSYNKFIMSLPTKYEYLNDYDKYLDILVIMDMPKDAWKIKGEAFKKTMESLKEVYDNMEDDERLKALNIKFKVREDEWKKLTWQDENYLISYPKTVNALVKEGVELHHCVKTFIFPVALGTTTILFIRKTDKPNKPFFTMEVKNGEIRQIHGFNNCNMEDKELVSFVMRWCEEKNIVFNNGTAAYGGEE